MYDYFDTHSHLYLGNFDADRDEIIKEMKSKSIGTITIGVDFESSEEAIKLADENENIFASVGYHPEDVNTESIFDSRIEFLANHQKVVGIGECGLDYYRLDEGSSSSIKNDYIKNVQREIFIKQIEISIKLEKPLILHIRPTKNSYDAYIDTLEILERYSNLYGSKLKGVSHFFAGDMSALRRFVDLGFAVSFTGVITFSRDYDEFVRYMPKNMILPETDSPFVAPVPYRGQRNSPLYIDEVVKKIAEIRGDKLEDLKMTFIDNTYRYFPKIRGIASKADL